MSRQAYPKYKPSGIEWLGEIPAGWITVSVKRKYAIQLGKMLQNNPESDADVSVPYIKALHVNWGKVNTSDLPEMWANPAEIGQFGVKSGDLLVCEGGEAGRAGIVSTLPTPCIIQNALHRVRGKDADVRFLQYVFHAVGSGGWFEVLCNKATIAHFTREKLAELRMPLPLNIDEQRAIAAFLDRETARIDALIAKKQRQIELLQGKRSALISHAVTKGLNPNAKMKDSGIEWLGEIPEHWEAMKIRRITKHHKQGYYTEEPYVDEGVKLVRITDIDDFGNISFQNMPFVPISESDEMAFKMIEGDFFFARSGTVGRFGLALNVERSVFASYLIRFSFKVSQPLFIKWFLLSKYFKESLISALHGGANQNVHAENIMDQWICIPPKDEQTAIAVFLNSETRIINNLISKIEESIIKLHEYRISLISAAVTGKIDVREEGS